MSQIITVLQTGDSVLRSVAALGGYGYTGNHRGADHAKLYAAARLPDIQASSFLELIPLNHTIFYAICF